jgi:hypothetical protein
VRLTIDFGCRQKKRSSWRQESVRYINAQVQDDADMAHEQSSRNMRIADRTETRCESLVSMSNHAFTFRQRRASVVNNFPSSRVSPRRVPILMIVESGKGEHEL